MIKTTLISLFFSIIVLILISILFYIFGKDIWYPYYEKCFITKSIEPVECKNIPQKEEHLPIPPIVNINIDEPEDKLSPKRRLNRLLADSDFIIYPKKLTIIGLKYEKQLEIWGEIRGRWSLINSYPFTAFSGQLGPKYREGDRQIPEGIYGISYLNPNSKFHLSMRVNYPNKFDRRMAKREKRTNLGGDIMIHGKDVTIGCIPIGDRGIEELYLLAEKVGIGNIKVILSPVDFRKMEVNIKNDKHPWLKELYRDIKKEIIKFKKD